MDDTCYSFINDGMRQQLEQTRDNLTVKIIRIVGEEGLSDEEKAQLASEVREELAELRRTRESLYRLLLSTNTLIDEFDTQLRESERAEHSKLPILPPTNVQIDIRERKNDHFAQGLTFYKLFWVFFIGCFAGVVIEVIWCVMKYGHYESRVGLIYGPFNLVYGFGALALTFFLYNYRNRNKLNSFVGGFVVGSVLEYICSWFQETVFGSTSWDYSEFPFNLNGRICLLYSIFWGILGIIWIKQLYPIMAEWILKIPNKVGKTLTWVLLAFMIFDSVATGVTVLRWSQRVTNYQPPANALERYIDKHYPDERMEKIFANLEFVGSSQDTPVVSGSDNIS